MLIVSNLYHSLVRFNENRNVMRLKKEGIPLETLMSNKEYAVLYITNNHAGGTKNYEDNFLAGKKALVLRRTGYSTDKDRYYSVEDLNAEKHAIIDKSKMYLLFENSYTDIIVSTLIDFDDIGYLKELIHNCQNHYQCKVTYLIHDFHCICPQCNLFINGRYYPPDDPDFPRQYTVKGEKISLSDWQQLWREFLLICNEIRCFSRSSKKILLTAYPELHADVITVVPHDMSYCHHTPIKGVEDFSLHIGVVGTCFGDFKGKPVVVELIKKYGNHVPVTLIGAQWWRFMLFRRKVKYLGTYQRDDLQKIIEKNKISCVIFPSLCPETFSYLISELMMMDIPVLCFDYGAQAEKIKKYKKGVLLKNKEELWMYLDRNR